MRRERSYERVRFPAAVLQQAFEVWQSHLTDISDESDTSKIVMTPRTKLREACFTAGAERWWPDTVEEFFADYAKFDHEKADLHVGGLVDETFIVHVRPTSVGVDIHLPTDADTKSVLYVFDANVDAARLPVADVMQETRRDVTIFIGHGHNPQWRDLKDHLHEKQRFAKVTAYETGERAGYTIVEVLEGLMDSAAFAILVHTAEDEDTSGHRYARPNVIHETGLFQGKLGFKRALVLLEEGCDEFTNIIGLHQIHFQPGHIASTFGDVVAAIYREFGAED